MQHKEHILQKETPYLSEAEEKELAKKNKIL